MKHLTFEDLASLLELVHSNNQYNEDDDLKYWSAVECRLIAECLEHEQ